ncbi:MAG: hypothetical protein AAFW83_07230 [Pseudomonadota bacterium]
MFLTIIAAYAIQIGTDNSDRYRDPFDLDQQREVIHISCKEDIDRLIVFTENDAEYLGGFGNDQLLNELNKNSIYTPSQIALNPFKCSLNGREFLVGIDNYEPNSYPVMFHSNWILHDVKAGDLYVEHEGHRLKILQYGSTSHVYSPTAQIFSTSRKFKFCQRKLDPGYENRNPDDFQMNLHCKAGYWRESDSPQGRARMIKERN